MITEHMFKFLKWKVARCQFGEKQGIMYLMYLGYVKSFALKLLNLCVKHSDFGLVFQVQFSDGDSGC